MTPAAYDEDLWGEFAAVVDLLVDLHAPVGGRCTVCWAAVPAGVTRAPWPCATRRLLAELPGGAL